MPKNPELFLASPRWSGGQAKTNARALRVARGLIVWACELDNYTAGLRSPPHPSVSPLVAYGHDATTPVVPDNCFRNSPLPPHAHAPRTAVHRSTPLHPPPNTPSEEPHHYRASNLSSGGDCGGRLAAASAGGRRPPPARTFCLLARWPDCWTVLDRHYPHRSRLRNPKPCLEHKRTPAATPASHPPYSRVSDSLGLSARARL
jgi:hypothetical protein